MQAHTNPNIGDNPHLTSGRLLAKNTIWNLAANGAPLVVAVFSIPILIRELGTARFGVLALAWALIGYAGLFDLGLGRALTQAVAKKLGVGEEHEVPQLVWTSLLLMLGLAIVGAVAIAGISAWLVHRVLRVPQGLQLETLRSFYLLAISLPAVITAAGLRGLLEAYQRFDLTTYIRVPLGVFAFAGPLLVLPFSHSLAPLVGILVVGRFVGCVAFFWLCLKVAPQLQRHVSWHRPSAGPLLKFGGWMTVSNVIGPLMVTMDRFVIGAMVSMAAVAYYATPYEVVTKLWVIPGSIVGVIFPAFSTSFVRDRRQAMQFYSRSLRYVSIALIPILLLVLVFARSGLSQWLGVDFAERSTRVLQWLAIGVFINSLGQVPFAMLQGAGRPDLTARLHLIEMPCYLLMLWLLIRSFGIDGAAAAWTVRVTVDALILFGLGHRILSAPVREGSFSREVHGNAGGAITEV